MATDPGTDCCSPLHGPGLRLGPVWPDVSVSGQLGLTAECSPCDAETESLRKT